MTTSVMIAYPAISPLTGDRHVPEQAIGMTSLGDRHHPDSLIEITGIPISRILLLFLLIYLKNDQVAIMSLASQKQLA